jgi:arginase family enzyme
MNESLVTQFGGPDAPYCDPATARVTIIPAPLEYSVCYMKGTRYGPQAILNASSQWERLSKHTYITIDLDALDPAEMPAVGTPEPGGLHWYQLLDLFYEICQRTTIVGMDVVELCPMPGQVRADFLAAKLAYKMIGYRFYDTK